ncbi:MAG: mechanosensitive ion channel [Desulfobulbaceae bacterium]|nr:mechanosensitive ion channel [Desulfobulbaceae bacterium]
MDNIIYQSLLDLGTNEKAASTLSFIMIASTIIVLSLFATWVVRSTLLRAVISFVKHNRCQWDDPLIKNNLFPILSWYVPLLAFYLSQDLLLPPDNSASVLLRRVLMAGFVIVTVRSVIALLNSIHDIYRAVRREGAASIRGYIDAARIITYVMGAIFILAVLTNRSPWGLLSVLGGLTAITMLVFKDTILGFVASIQLTGTDMIRLGDWIEMPSYGADGDVIDISIHCVRVRNWDKTITTIPTYALITNSFKNWRGMSESGGRRIKRAINIDMQSIRFVTDEELQKFSKIKLLDDYIKNRQQEIEQYNREHDVDTSVLINGRRQTNVGIFRAYAISYLKNHPKIHSDMTFLVRHLQPGEFGLPIEVYVFSSDQVWANYESIQADIFDHFLAALPMFDLRVYQNPSGYDFRLPGSAPAVENTIGSRPRSW